MKYVLFSKKHTKAEDEFLCFWRANNQGYTECVDSVGIYEEIKKGYHDSDNTFPIEMQDFNSMETEISDGCVKVLNNEKNRKIIGI